MFDFGFGSSELLVVAIIAVIVIGPKELPKVLRALGKMMSGLRSYAGQFQGHLDDAMKDSGFDEVRREVANLKNMASTEITQQADTFSKMQEEARTEMNKLLAEPDAKKPEAETSAEAKTPAVEKFAPANAENAKPKAAKANAAKPSSASAKTTKPKTAKPKTAKSKTAKPESKDA